MVHNLKNDTTHGLLGAIRDGDWKYIRDITLWGTVKEALYNVKRDFKERRNLSKFLPSVTQRMRNLLKSLSLSMVPADDLPEVEGNPHMDENGYIQSGWCAA